MTPAVQRLSMWVPVGGFGFLDGQSRVTEGGEFFSNRQKGVRMS